MSLFAVSSLYLVTGCRTCWKYGYVSCRFWVKIAISPFDANFQKPLNIGCIYRFFINSIFELSQPILILSLISSLDIEQYWWILVLPNIHHTWVLIIYYIRSLHFSVEDREEEYDGSKKCTDCDYICDNKVMMKQHMTKAHGNSRVYMCPQCGKREWSSNLVTPYLNWHNLAGSCLENQKGPVGTKLCLYRFRHGT